MSSTSPLTSIDLNALSTVTGGGLIRGPSGVCKNGKCTTTTKPLVRRPRGLTAL